MIGALGVLSWLQVNLKKLMQKATSPDYDPDTDSNEAISEAVAGMVALMPGSGILQTAYFRYGVEATIEFPILDKTGAPVNNAQDLDSEIAKDNGNMADCTNEASQISGSQGGYRLVLTVTEMQAHVIYGEVKTSTADAKTTCFVIYPGK